MTEFTFPYLDDHPQEQQIIGRILMAYGELEIDLCQCVAAALDIDLAVKAMFRVRGESQRIQIADGLARRYFVAKKLGTEFSEVIGDMAYAVSIRNYYAHCTWYSRKEIGGLAFINFEDAAHQNAHIDSINSKFYRVDLALLKQQESFFSYVQNCLLYLKETYPQGRKRSTRDVAKPKKVARPPKYKSE
jgi:hypothetical protein